MKGSFVAMQGYPHHFQYQNGEPVWFIGETAEGNSGGMPFDDMSNQILNPAYWLLTGMWVTFFYIKRSE